MTRNNCSQLIGPGEFQNSNNTLKSCLCSPVISGDTQCGLLDEKLTVSQPLSKTVVTGGTGCALDLRLCYNGVLDVETSGSVGYLHTRTDSESTNLSGDLPEHGGQASIIEKTITIGTDTKTALSVNDIFVHKSGGLAETIDGNKTFQNDVTIQGNLCVLGSCVINDVECLTVEDPMITVNSDGSETAGDKYGIEACRSTSGNVALWFCENAGQHTWYVCADPDGDNTYSEYCIVLKDPATGNIEASHNSLQGLQGGSATERYHLTQSEHDTLTTGVNADSLHIHSANNLDWGSYIVPVNHGGSGQDFSAFDTTYDQQLLMYCETGTGCCFTLSGVCVNDSAGPATDILWTSDKINSVIGSASNHETLSNLFGGPSGTTGSNDSSDHYHISKGEWMVLVSRDSSGTVLATKCVADTMHHHTSAGIDGFDESVQDVVGSLVYNTNTISWTYDDTNNRLCASLVYTSTDPITLSESASGLTATLNYADTSTIDLGLDASNNLCASIIAGSITDSHISASANIAWSKIDKTGSNLTDLDTYNHNDLQNIQGGTTGEYYHLTQSQYNTLTTGLNADTLHLHSFSNLQGLDLTGVNNNYMLFYDSGTGLWCSKNPVFSCFSDVDDSARSSSNRFLCWDSANLCWIASQINLSDPGLTGVLPVDLGGTGSTTSNFSDTITDEVVIWNGSQLIGSGCSLGSLGGGGGASSLNDLSDVTVSNCQIGQLLCFNGSVWVNWTHNFATTTDLNAYVLKAGDTMTGTLGIDDGANATDTIGLCVFNGTQFSELLYTGLQVYYDSNCYTYYHNNGVCITNSASNFNTCLLQTGFYYSGPTYSSCLGDYLNIVCGGSCGQLYFNGLFVKEVDSTNNCEIKLTFMTSSSQKVFDIWKCCVGTTTCCNLILDPINQEIWYTDSSGNTYCSVGYVTPVSCVSFFSTDYQDGHILRVGRSGNSVWIYPDDPTNLATCFDDRYVNVTGDIMTGNLEFTAGIICFSGGAGCYGIHAGRGMDLRWASSSYCVFYYLYTDEASGCIEDWSKLYDITNNYLTEICRHVDSICPTTDPQNPTGTQLRIEFANMGTSWTDFVRIGPKVIQIACCCTAYEWHSINSFSLNQCYLCIGTCFSDCYSLPSGLYEWYNTAQYQNGSVMRVCATSTGSGCAIYLYPDTATNLANDPAFADRFVDVTGDTMTGGLCMDGVPVFVYCDVTDTSQHAAALSYNTLALWSTDISNKIRLNIDDTRSCAEFQVCCYDGSNYCLYGTYLHSGDLVNSIQPMVCIDYCNSGTGMHTYTCITNGRIVNCFDYGSITYLGCLSYASMKLSYGTNCCYIVTAGARIVCVDDSGTIYCSSGYHLPSAYYKINDASWQDGNIVRVCREGTGPYCIRLYADTTSNLAADSAFADRFVDVTGDTMTGDLVMNGSNVCIVSTSPNCTLYSDAFIHPYNYEFMTGPYAFPMLWREIYDLCVQVSGGPVNSLLSGCILEYKEAIVRCYTTTIQCLRYLCSVQCSNYFVFRNFAESQFAYCSCVIFSPTAFLFCVTCSVDSEVDRWRWFYFESTQGASTLANCMIFINCHCPGGVATDSYTYIMFENDYITYVSDSAVSCKEVNWDFSSTLLFPSDSSVCYSRAMMNFRGFSNRRSLSCCDFTTDPSDTTGNCYGKSLIYSFNGICLHTSICTQWYCKSDTSLCANVCSTGAITPVDGRLYVLTSMVCCAGQISGSDVCWCYFTQSYLSSVNNITTDGTGKFLVGYDTKPTLQFCWKVECKDDNTQYTRSLSCIYTDFGYQGLRMYYSLKYNNFTDLSGSTSNEEFTTIGWLVPLWYEYNIFDTTYDGYVICWCYYESTDASGFITKNYCFTLTNEIKASKVKATYADFAEYYILSESDVSLADKGLLVSISKEDGEVCIAKSGDNFFGVVSCNAGMIIRNDLSSCHNSIMVALKGLIDVKICGKISKGDYITILNHGVGIRSSSPTRLTSIEEKAYDQVGFVKAILS